MGWIENHVVEVALPTAWCDLSGIVRVQHIIHIITPVIIFACIVPLSPATLFYSYRYPAFQLFLAQCIPLGIDRLLSASAMNGDRW